MQKTIDFFARALKLSRFAPEEVILISETTLTETAPDANGYRPDVRLSFRVGGHSEGIAVNIDLNDAGDNNFDSDVSFPEGNEDWANPAMMLAALGMVVEKFYELGYEKKYGPLVGGCINE